MSNLDAVYGEFGEDSKNPYFGLPDPGDQWPEGRGFARSMSNPYAMGRLAQVLCGFSAHLVEGGGRCPLTADQRRQGLMDIAGLLEIVHELCPEITSSEPVEIDWDWSMEPYVVDERLDPMIQRALVSGKRE